MRVSTGALGLVLQALANVLHLGEIDMPASQADRSACRIAQGGHTRANPAIGAILVPQAVLDLVLRKLPGKQAMHGRNGLLAVLGMQSLDPGLGAIGQFGIAVANELLPARGAVDFVRE